VQNSSGYNNHNGKPSDKPASESKVLYVSDSQLIVDVLFRSPFYGAYISYYKYPAFYRNDTAADFLFARGIASESVKYENIEKILHDYSISESKIIPDLLLLLNTCWQYFESNRELTDQEPIMTNNFKALKEVLTLRKFLEGYDAKKNEAQIRIDFRINENDFRISDEAIIRDVADYLKDLSTMPAYQNIFKFNYLEEDELVYNNFIKIFPAENSLEITLIKLWTVRRSSRLLYDYLESKKISELSQEKPISETTLYELTGRLLSTIGFMPAETEFIQNESLKSSFKSYSTLLSETVKSLKHVNPD